MDNTAVSLPTEGFSFTLSAKDGHARAGLLQTPRGTFATPIFMPVGTQAVVKTLTPEEVQATGAGIILANTYHLWIRPGPELIDRRGGIHRFMGWPQGVLTDSGGFQVFSLAALRKIDEDGVTFRSHLDGTPMRLTPEEAMRVQALIGSDIAMVLDECPPGKAERPVIEGAMRRSTAWAKRCLAYPAREGQAKFGIVQGGVHEDLRRSHLADIAALPFDGIALGGFSVGEPPAAMHQTLSVIGPELPQDKPHYLMGVGKPEDLLIGVAAGIDMFDCVLPSRNARNGQALTWHGPLNIKRAQYKDDDSPIDSTCKCSACLKFSRAYLRHLTMMGEALGARLLTQHNLYFYADLMGAARKAIMQGSFEAFLNQTLPELRSPSP